MDDLYVPTDADAPDDGAVSESANLGLVKGDVAYDELAEQSAVGGMLLDSRVIDDVMDELRPSDFWNPKHEVIARAVATLHAKSMPTDVIAVMEELTSTGKLREAGGAEYLHQLTSIVPTAANAGYYATIVHKKARQRRLTAAGHRITAMGQASEGDPDEHLERARQELDAVPTGKGTKPRKIGEALPGIIDDLGKKPTYMRTPWAGLDELIGGFTAGQLVVVAGRPGGGKSIALLQIGTRLAHEGTVAFSSLEMNEAELGVRLLSQYGPVDMRKLRDHQFTDVDLHSIAQAKRAIEDAPLFIDYTTGATLAQIRAHARAVARTGNLVAICVDYLQLVKAEGTNREQEVAAVAEGLKALAKDLGVVVIAAAQLKRLQSRRPADLPTLDDLRESGSIEQAADVVILLHRDPKKKPHDLVMVVAKNRHGKSGSFILEWEAQFSRIRDRGWSPTALIDEQIA